MLEQLSIHKEELLTQNQELQEKQDELNTTRNYFEHLFEYSPIGYVLVSKYGEVLKVNRQIEKWFNIQEEDVQNREINFSKFLSLEEQSAYTKFLSNAFKSDVPIEAEFEVDRKDETWYFQIVALTLKFENAEPQVLLSITNVTQLFNLKQVAEQTKEKLEQLALVAKKTDNLVIITDRHGLIEWVNHGFLNETGFSSKEVLGKKPEDFLQGKDSDRKVIERLSKAIALGESIEVELINYRKDNTPYWVDISIQPIYNDRNLLEKFISIQKVITDKKRQEETLQRNIQLLEKTNQELDNFVYRVSHDLRAPISSVLGLIEISRLTDDWDTIYYYLDLQEQSMKKLDNFIRDILDYSRNARQKVKQEEIDIEGIINSIFEGLQFSDTTNLISKSIKIDGETAFYSDESRVKVILSNLISNGVKYAAPFRAESHINFSIKVDEQKMEIIYQDNGIGILKEHLPHIFEMFYRATDVNKGSGLGLYIVKETVNKLGGTISVSSPQGLGTQFTIVLPNELPKKAEYK